MNQDEGNPGVILVAGRTQGGAPIKRYDTFQVSLFPAFLRPCHPGPPGAFGFSSG
jgi:hypothetical protein